MAVYEIRIAAAAAKELDGVTRKKDRRTLVDRILALAEEPRPRGCVKLSGAAKLYRIRQGPYRIVYFVEDNRLLVIVVRIADRKDVYRKGRQKRSPKRSRPFGSDR